MMLSEQAQADRYDGNKVKRWLFVLLMLASGFAGISYEILYGRMLGNLIGDQFIVSAAILITFLLGIAIGSRYAWRLWASLWLIEAVIGIYGAGFAFGTDALAWLFYASLPVLPAGLRYGHCLHCTVAAAGFSDWLQCAAVCRLYVPSLRLIFILRCLWRV